MEVQDNTNIDVQNFRTWQNDPVTQTVMQWLEDYREFLKLCMLNPDEILSDKGQIYYAQYIGGIECVDRVLNLQLSDLVEEDDERNQREQMDTSGVSDQS